MLKSILLLVLCLIGILETIYLIHKRKKAEHPVCIIGEGCSVVLNSKYNKTLGIHNDLLGLIFYIITIGVIVTSLLTRTPDYFIQICLITGTISSIIFMIIQFGVLRSFCFWCTMSALTIFAMDAIYVFI